jgi:osmoprotectant transport system ATP-binding protein
VRLRSWDTYVADFVGADRALKVLGLHRVKDAVNKNLRNVVKASQGAREVLKFLEQEDLKQAIVVENNKPVGYAGKGILAHQEGPVKDVAKSYPKLADMRDTLKDVISSMLMHDMRLLCVVDDTGDLVGTINMNDIQKAILKTYDEEEPT